MARRKKSKYDKYFSPATRSSITGFSKSATGSGKRRKSYSERRRNKILLISLVAIVGAAAVFTASFFITNTLLNISDAEPTTQAPTQEPSAGAGEESETGSETSGGNTGGNTQIRARVGEASLLDGGAALDAYINTLKSSGQSAVVIDFKDETGYLNYPSAIANVQNTDIVSRARANAAESVRKLRDSGISVIARVHCFRDSLMPRVDRTAAVHYGNSTTLWLDNEPSRGGKPWLNPYSQQTVQYLSAVIAEVSALGVDGILLDSVQFPDLSSGAAYFDGENGGASRNATLINFINSVVSASGSTPVFCAMQGEPAITNQSTVYDGSLWNANAAGFAVDIRSLAADAQKNYPSGKRVIEIRTDASGDGEYILD